MESVWGVDHGSVSKSIPGQTLGAARRAASINARSTKVKRVATAFPKGDTKNNWKPTHATIKNAPDGLSPFKTSRKRNITPLLGAGAVGAGVGAGTTAAVKKSVFSKATTIPAGKPGGPPRKSSGNNAYQAPRTRPRDVAQPGKPAARPTKTPAEKQAAAVARAEKHKQAALETRANYNRRVGYGVQRTSMTRKTIHSQYGSKSQRAAANDALAGGRTTRTIVSPQRSRKLPNIKLTKLPKGKAGLIGAAAGGAAALGGAAAFAAPHDKRSGRTGYKHNPYG